MSKGVREVENLTDVKEAEHENLLNSNYLPIATKYSGRLR